MPRYNEAPRLVHFEDERLAGSAPYPLAGRRLLWSADLANLEAGIERIEPFADAFHFDVSDAHFAPDLLFFPT